MSEELAQNSILSYNNAMVKPTHIIDLSPDEPVNKTYQTRIVKEMAKLPEPKLRNAINYIRSKGNVDFYLGFGLDPSGIKFTFGPNDIGHEAMHLCTQIGHTMQHEYFGIYFDYGLLFGVNARYYEPYQVIAFKSKLEDAVQEYEAMEHHQDKPPERASLQNQAIYFAAGMYLREKVDCFKRQGFLTKSYSEQMQFCEQYALKINDQIPPSDNKAPWPISAYTVKDTLEDIIDTPYALVRLSPKEWRAIKAVALGLCEPDQTDYPNRLTAVKDALVTTGLFYNKRGAQAERLKKQSTGIALP